MDRRTIEIHTLEDPHSRLIVVKNIYHIKVMDNNCLYVHLTMGPAILITLSNKKETERCYNFLKLSINSNHNSNEFVEHYRGKLQLVA